MLPCAVTLYGQTSRQLQLGTLLGEGRLRMGRGNGVNLGFHGTHLSQHGPRRTLHLIHLRISKRKQSSDTGTAFLRGTLCPGRTAEGELEELGRTSQPALLQWRNKHRPPARCR